MSGRYRDGYDDWDSGDPRTSGGYPQQRPGRPGHGEQGHGGQGYDQGGSGGVWNSDAPLPGDAYDADPYGRRRGTGFSGHDELRPEALRGSRSGGQPAAGPHDGRQSGPHRVQPGREQQESGPSGATQSTVRRPQAARPGTGPQAARPGTGPQDIQRGRAPQWEDAGQRGRNLRDSGDLHDYRDPRADRESQGMRDQRDAWDRREGRNQRQTGGFRPSTDLPGGDFLPGFEGRDDDWGRGPAAPAARPGRRGAAPRDGRGPDGRYPQEQFPEERFQQDRYPGERGRPKHYDTGPSDPGRYERDRPDADRYGRDHHDQARYDQARYDQARYDQDQYFDDEDGDAPRRKRGGARRLAPWIALLVVLALLTPLGYFGWHLYKTVQAKDHPADYVGAGVGPQVVVQVESGDTATSLGLRLVTDGVVESQRAFILAAEHSTNTTGLEAGFFQMNRHMQASLAYAYLVSPKHRLQHTVTIPEGLRASDILIRLSKGTGIPIGQFQAVLKSPAPLALPPYANNNPEGYLFPATYAIQPHETALQILQAMTDRFAQESQSANLPASVTITAGGGTVHLTTGQVIIVASLVQAEAGRDSDFAQVAEVIYNRLKAGTPLQMDSTVFYGLQTYGTAATTAQLKIPNAYSTYLHKGLPPGPIDSPGDLAIQAALHPATGTLKFFFGCSNGRTIFSSTQALTKANC